MSSDFIQPASGSFDFTTGRINGFVDRNGGVMTLGEHASSTVTAGSAVTLSTATTANVTSMILSTGRWNINGVIDYFLTAASTTVAKAGISSASASYNLTDAAVNAPFANSTATATFQQITPTVELNITEATRTMYLVAQLTFSEGTAAAYGTIRARRAA